jgi:RimJ/RimL family protein N-acetyltransferase
MFLPLHTPRLTLRAFTPADATTFAAYRNDAEVARLQDWELPVTEAAALEFVTAQSAVSGPVQDDWVQLAVEHEGELVGDVAVGLDAGGRRAMIGYTLRRDRQGAGLAREAVSAVVDALFDKVGVHRVAATLDPRNVASARLLEQLGFRYEGCARAAAPVRGAWEDDDRYAMLRADRDAWRARPTGRPASVTLVEITGDNAREVGRLATHRSQESLVSPVLGSYRDALFPGERDGVPVVPWLRAAVADGEYAGFVMVAEATSTRPDPYLWRLLVDRRHQRRGIGARVIELLAQRLRAEGHARLRVSWVDERGGPAPFYRGLGFEPTGEVHGGEIVAVLTL